MGLTAAEKYEAAIREYAAAPMFVTKLTSPGERRVMIAGGYSAAVSMARSLLVSRPDPVLLVVDADTLVIEEVSQRARYLQDALSTAAPADRFDFFLARPSLDKGGDVGLGRLLSWFRAFADRVVATV